MLDDMLLYCIFAVLTIIPFSRCDFCPTRSAVLLSQPLYYWSFNEEFPPYANSGSVAGFSLPDQVGVENVSSPLSFGGCCSEEKGERALRYNDNAVAFTFNPFTMPNSDFSVGFWLLIEDRSGPHWVLLYRNDKGDGHVRIGFAPMNDGNLMLKLSSVKMGLNGIEQRDIYRQWRYIVVTYAVANGRAKYYLDGVLIGTDNFANNFVFEPNGTLVIGSPLIGNVDEVCIFDRVLNETEILAHFTRSPCPTRSPTISPSSSPTPSPSSAPTLSPSFLTIAPSTSQSSSGSSVSPADSDLVSSSSFSFVIIIPLTVILAVMLIVVFLFVCFMLVFLRRRGKKIRGQGSNVKRRGEGGSEHSPRRARRSRKLVRSSKSSNRAETQEFGKKEDEENFISMTVVYGDVSDLPALEN